MQKPWMGLEAELNELESHDPVVKAARDRLNKMPEEEERRKRHLAARKAVGKRKMPED